LIPISDDPKRRVFPWVTVLIILANVAVFIYELGLSQRGLQAFVMSVGTVPLEITTGQDLPPPAPGPVYITLITSMFVHGGFLHIASNMLYLWVFGDNVEDAFGHVGYFLFYFAAGIAAGLTHVFVNAQSDVPSVGASGAIAGVLGAYILMFPSARVRTVFLIGPFITMGRIPAAFLIGFWFLTQFISGVASLGASTEQTDGVAVWAHIGGFVAGLIMAAALRRRRPVEEQAAW
jgi:membrane associated rhomboid family serine protease